MYRSSVDWISLSAPTPAGSPLPGCWWTPFIVAILISSSSPAKNCVDIVFINLWFKCPVAFLTALRIVTDSIFNSWNLAFHYSYMLQDYMWPGEQSGWTGVWKPSSKEARLSTHWLNSGWQSKNPSSTLRLGGEAVDPQPSSGLCSREDFTSSCWVRLECCLHQHQEAQNWTFAVSENVFHLALKFGILRVTTKLGRCVKSQWNFQKANMMSLLCNLLSVVYLKDIPLMSRKLGKKSVMGISKDFCLLHTCYSIKSYYRNSFKELFCLVKYFLNPRLWSIEVPFFWFEI